MRVFTLSLALCVGLAGLGGLTPPAEAQSTATAIASGQFVDADARHQGDGTATLAQTSDGRTVLQLSEFSVTPGPDLEVWLVVDGSPATSGAVLASQWVSLGSLQSPQGTQVYEVPANVDASAYGSIVIWCEDFSVLFATASLN
ncbi:DM13 domain-containing protein [Gymnodinialimonas hymeniacidonis]|uniref:DM13 domain-containing protein n=1 Tax=Gymnodinialimonas hymeniacidonis TaxID=3126508 RepID=UPI0034C69D70